MARLQKNSERLPPACEPLVLLKENQLAHSAAHRLIAARDEGVWLVYLYGPAGVGKSHLVRYFVR